MRELYAIDAEWEKGYRHAVAISADGTCGVIAALNGIVVLNLESGQEVRFVETSRCIDAVAISGDGRRAALALSGGKLSVIDIQRECPLCDIDLDGLLDCAISADGHRVLAASPLEITIIDGETNAEPRTLSLSESISAVAMSGDGERAITACKSGRILVLRLKTGSPLTWPKDSSEEIYDHDLLLLTEEATQHVQREFASEEPKQHF